MQPNSIAVNPNRSNPMLEPPLAWIWLGAGAGTTVAPVERTVDEPIVEVKVVEALVYVESTAYVEVDVHDEVVSVVAEAVVEPETFVEAPPVSSLPPSAPGAGPPGGAVDSVALPARRMNASRVLPTVGALIEPTMPC